MIFIILNMVPPTQQTKIGILPYVISLFIFLPITIFSLPAISATLVPFTLNMSEPVNVTGCPTNCPRIVLDVGGNTPRYAEYVSGSGTSTLTFAYSAQEGDVDLDGITITSNNVDLNTSGTIKDLNGNDLASLTFTSPNTSGVKINYPSITMDFINNSYKLGATSYPTLTDLLTAAGGSYTRSSIATYFDSSGNLQIASAGVPRLDHDPVTHTARGILIESSRTNLLTYSSQFDNVVWEKNNSTITANAGLSPDGSSSADLLSNASGTTSRVRSAFYSATGGTSYSISVYAKAGATNFLFFQLSDFVSNAAGVNFDLSTGTIGSNSLVGDGIVISRKLTPVGNGWYRAAATISFTASRNVRFSMNAASNNTNETTAVGGSIYIWGAQLEDGRYPTSYIPTVASAVTRLADDLTLGSNPLLKQNAWSAFAQSYALPTGYSYSFLGRWDNNGFACFNGEFGLYRALSTNGAVNLTRTVPTPYYSGVAKTAIAIDTSGRSLTANGLTPASDTVNITSGASWGSIGRNNLTNSHLNGHLQILKIYNKKLPDTQIQLLTQ